MQQAHHTLKRDLTKTIVLWSATFFALLGITFLLSFHSLEGYILDLMADHRLNYQVREFAKHLDEQDSRSIAEESHALVQEPVISGILIVDASGELMHVVLSNGNKPELRLHEPLTLNNLKHLIEQHGNLHLYMREIPGHNHSLALVMDDRPVEIAIFTTAAWTGLLMLMLVMLSIKALHRSLIRQLVQPVEHLRQAVEADKLGELNDQAIQTIEDELPDEAADILEAFDHLKHSRDDFKVHIIAMMEAFPACFWWSDDGRRYAGMSDKSATVIHTPPQDIQGQPLWSWSEAKTLISSNNRQIQQAIDDKLERLDFAYQVRAGKTVYWYGESITLCYDKFGKLETVYGIINDISARKNKQMEKAEQLELAHRMEATATLVGGIAHEFNNALAGMNGNVFLIKQAATDQRTLERLHRIEQLIERSARMIEQMLAFARKSLLQSRAIDMISFLKSFQATALPTLPDRAQFNLLLDEEQQNRENRTESIINADQSKLLEALMQLLSNANKATEKVDFPRISIVLNNFDADDRFISKFPQVSSRRLVHLQVQDNGCGIPDDILDRIFEPFFTTREVGEGTGLGLPMVYGYVNQLGGCIDVESESGHGSTFHLYFPRLAESQKTSHPDKLLKGHGETILIVDDERIFRESTCEVLKRMGYQTIAASNGNEAIDLFRQHQDDIQIIFMDIIMPGITGVQASRRIREIDPHIPIIFITAYDRTQPLEPEVYEKNSEVINKPFRISVLSQSIQKALEQSAKSGDRTS